VWRLSLYLRHLQQLSAQGIDKVSSAQLAGELQLGSAQVRRDLAILGQFGRPGIGYRVKPLIQQLRSALGTDRIWKVILVGVGQLGGALLRYEVFSREGFKFVSAFDIQKAKIGKRVGAVTVRHIGKLAAIVKRQKVELAMVTVPAPAVKEVVERLIQAGIKGILNFAPAAINPRPGVTINQVDLAAHLEQLSFQVTRAACTNSQRR